MAALERDRTNAVTIWTWFNCTENHCQAVDKENEWKPPFRLAAPTCEWKKEVSQGESVVVVANGNVIASCQTWRILESNGRIERDRNFVRTEYTWIFFPWRKLEWRIFWANTVMATVNSSHLSLCSVQFPCTNIKHMPYSFFTISLMP